MSEIQLQSGMKIAQVEKGPITLEMLKLYAKASGDYNPIHTDEAAAKGAGLPGIIAHGMLSAGLLADHASRFMKDHATGWKLAEFQVRFKAMTHLGDKVTLSGSVKSADTDGIRIELSATNSRGELTTQAFAEFTPPRSSDG